MAPISLLVASLDFTKEETFAAALQRFSVDRSLVASGAEIISDLTWGEWWKDAVEWLSRPDIIAIITAWWITYTVVMTIFMTLGFGPAGVLAGSLAAAFQSFMYAGFTPAGGIFATLTSMAMAGILWPFVLVASLIATGVAALVWYCGVGA